MIAKVRPVTHELTESGKCDEAPKDVELVALASTIRSEAGRIIYLTRCLNELIEKMEL